MKYAVVGGGGYLGCIVADMLAVKHHEVTIVDTMMYGKDFMSTMSCGEKIQYREDNVLDIEEVYWDEYDEIIWCCDQDISDFYERDIFRPYIAKILDMLHLLRKSHTIRYIGSCITEMPEKIFTDLVPEVLEYRAYLTTIKDMVSPEQYIAIPYLYGASPRMRWDTHVNELIYCVLTQQKILLGSDFLIPQPICSVTHAATQITNMLSDCEVMSFVTGVYSQIEVAHIVSAIMCEQLDIDVISVVATHLPQTIYRYYDFDEIVEDSMGLAKSIEMICMQLKKGNVGDVLDDKCNNTTVINNMISSHDMMRTYLEF